MKFQRKISRWSKSAQRGLRKLWPVRKVLALPPWRAVELSYGRGIALSLEGQDLWLVSPDVALEPTQEAAVCLLAQWCAQESISLRMPGVRPSSAFLSNVLSATALMGSWWKHPAIRFLTPDALVLPPPATPAISGPKALLFSGGVDAFYSLVMNPDVRVLVYIVFDIPLAHRAAWEMKIKFLREVAESRGIALITVFTNRKEHPTLKDMSWGHHYGTLLAAVAHCLHKQAAHWMISASGWPGHVIPHGTHPDLDWRWGSEAIFFSHFGIDQWRGEKLAVMAEDKQAFHHMLVCFETTSSGRNCGECEKCVRTRLAHHCEVPGRRCEYMPDSPTLLEAVNGLDFLRFYDQAPNYERSRNLLPSGDPLIGAIDRLLKRSLPKTRWSRLKAYILRHL